MLFSNLDSKHNLALGKFFFTNLIKSYFKLIFLYHLSFVSLGVFVFVFDY